MGFFDPPLSRIGRLKCELTRILTRITNHEERGYPKVYGNYCKNYTVLHYGLSTEHTLIVPESRRVLRSQFDAFDQLAVMVGSSHGNAAKRMMAPFLLFSWYGDW